MSASPSSPSEAMCTSWGDPRNAARMSFWIVASSSQNTILPTAPPLYARYGGEGERELEHRPLAQRALDPRAAAVHLDDLAHDREPKAGPLDVPRRAGLQARVALEDLLE